MYTDDPVRDADNHMTADESRAELINEYVKDRLEDRTKSVMVRDYQIIVDEINLDSGEEMAELFGIDREVWGNTMHGMIVARAMVTARDELELDADYYVEA